MSNVTHLGDRRPTPAPVSTVQADGSIVFPSQEALDAFIRERVTEVLPQAIRDLAAARPKRRAVRAVRCGDCGCVWPAGQDNCAACGSTGVR